MLVALVSKCGAAVHAYLEAIFTFQHLSSLSDFEKRIE
jgi:hypothetical protein